MLKEDTFSTSLKNSHVMKMGVIDIPRKHPRQYLGDSRLQNKNKDLSLAVEALNKNR